VAYDPAYAYEIGHIVKDGMRRMFGAQPENVFYYLTIYNEPILQPAEPAGVDVEGILRGMHLVSPAADPHAPLRAQLLSSGSILPETIRAQQLLREQWNVHADVWSVTSWTELRRDGLECDRYNFLHPDEPARVPFVTQRLQGRPGPVIAVSDWVRATQDGLRNWMPGEFTSLGTDGYGISDTRGAARRHFLVDAESTAAATLGMLARSGQFDPATAMRAIDGYQLHDPTAADPGNTEGSA
jgi:pyruvate dehydrogenase E1 component